ncbi:glycosyltransferase [Rhodococcus ruber]|uniref:Glycosyltransferase n=1 Tax=Rhodococcus ruber TaxID=1830 RepID=A0ABT4ML18_9NOCA|nr:glycosyltransferase [Rhodococcus ruber]MCZ4520745.1 glycosyltransferase [Rhodococcus ruber]
MPIGLVSVILPCFNGLPDVDVQLAALAAQDYEGDFEVIVSDNGSTDGLREHLDQLGLPVDIRWIDSSDVQGTSHAKNAGIAAARGDFLAFTDQDDAVYPNWLTALTRAAETADAVGGPIEVHTLNSPKVATWRDVPAPADRFETEYLPFAHGNNFAMWRRVVDQVGNFDENLVAGGEDIDISWRIQQAGFSLAHTPDALVAYRLRDTVTATFRQGVRYGRSSYRISVKHGSRGAWNPPLVKVMALQAWGIVYLAIARNPCLPKILHPLPSGRWALLLGQFCGAFQVRLEHVQGLVSRRLPGRWSRTTPRANAAPSGSTSAHRYR